MRKVQNFTAGIEFAGIGVTSLLFGNKHPIVNL